MDLSCIVVFGVLCVPPEYGDVTQRTGHIVTIAGQEERLEPVPDALVKLGVQIDFYSTDYGYSVPRFILERLCAGDKCFYYRKSCDVDEMRCTYLFGEVRLHPLTGRNTLMPGTFFITYNSEDALRRVEENISIVWGADNEMRTPVARLKTVAVTPRVLECPRIRTTIIQGC